MGAWSGLDGRVKSRLVYDIVRLLAAVEERSENPDEQWTEVEYIHAGEARREAQMDDFERKEVRACLVAEGRAEKAYLCALTGTTDTSALKNGSNIRQYLT